MAGRSFEVTAVWDNDAKVWYSDSDITGLHVEADTLEGFEQEVKAHAADLVLENHYSEQDTQHVQLKDLPSVVIRLPQNGSSAA